MNGELFEAPFNLAGELIDNSVTAEGEARIRALSAINARQQQRNLFVNVTESDVKREMRLQAMRKQITFDPHKRRPSEHFV